MTTETMALQGSLKTMSVADVLQFLAVGRKTGLLKITRAKILKGIYFEEGVIVGSSTNDPHEYFGQVLIHYGKIDEKQLKSAMAKQRKSGGRLGQVLVATKVLTQPDVESVLRIRTLDIIYDLFLWRDGQFEFVVQDPLPEDFTRVQVEATKVIMDGAYRADELARYRTLIPSDRAIMELGSGWTSSLETGKPTRQLLYFVEKRMSVAEICYNMHSAPFDVYAQLFELVKSGLAHVAGELPEIQAPSSHLPNLPEDSADLLLLARRELNNDSVEQSLSIIHDLLEREPKNAAAQSILVEAETRFVEQVYTKISPTAVPRLVVGLDSLSEQQLGPQEGFVLSRINGEWDVQSILSICPFREADSLRMIKTLLDRGVIGF